MGCGARLDVLETRNVCYPCQQLNPKFLVVRLFNSNYTDCATYAPTSKCKVLLFQRQAEYPSHGREECACRLLVGRRRGKRPFGIPVH